MITTDDSIDFIFVHTVIAANFFLSFSLSLSFILPQRQ